MTNFPFLIFLTVVTTNWVNFPGDLHREGPTNLIHQYQLVSTNIHPYQVFICSNPLPVVHVGSGTNGVTVWTNPPATIPSALPGQFSKP